jgi:hypothetical protein
MLRITDTTSKWIIRRPSTDSESCATEEEKAAQTKAAFLQTEGTLCDCKPNPPHQDNFITFGFTRTLINNEQHQKCVICLNIGLLVSESLKSPTIKRYLNNHTQNMKLKFFKRGMETHLKSKIIFVRRVTVPHKTLTAYYCIRKTMETHQSASRRACCYKMTSIMHGESVDQRPSL